MVLFCDVQNNENTQHCMKDICSLNSLRCYNGDKKVPSLYDWRDQFNKGVGKHAQGWKLNLQGLDVSRNTKTY